MEEKIKSALEQGEELLWSGSPEAFETLDKTNKSSIIRGSIIKGGITLALIIAYVIYGSNNADVKPGILALVAAIGALIVIAPLTNASTIRKKMGYAITNKRILTVRDEAKGIELDQIKTAAIKTDADGHSTLLCGPEALKAPVTRWRADCCLGGRENRDTHECACMVWYALPKDEKLMAILKEKLPL